MSGMKTAIRPCPICAGKSCESLHRMDLALFANTPLPDSYELIACVDCGFTYADLDSSQQDYDDYYRNMSKYEDRSVATGGGDFSWEQDRFDTVAELLDAHIPDRRAAVLDIGCANGGLLNVLADKGFRDLSGLDHAVSCVEEIKSNGFNGYLGGITDRRQLPNRRYGMLVLSHVLEHIYDLDLTMRHCNCLLDDGGLVYMETPNVAAYGKFKTVPYYFLDAEHINHFTHRSLENLAGQHGLIVDAKGDKTILAAEGVDYPATWILARKARGKGREWVRDDTARIGVLEHLSNSEAIAIRPRLRELVDSGQEVIVWGAGSYTQRLLANSMLGQCNIRYFVDSDRNKWGRKLQGIEVRDPRDIDIDSLPVVICAAWVGQEIHRQMLDMGLRNPCIVL